MNEIKIFENSEFGSVRTAMIDDEPWLVGKDVAVALGYENPQKALRDHVDDEDKKMGERNVTPSITDTLGREQYPTFVNESGVYALVFGSKLESAKKFKHWVTSEVLPSIRKTGGYQLPQTYAEALRALADKAEEAERLEKQNALLITDNERMRPKEVFADAVATSDDTILIGQLAKILKGNDIEIGQNRLFKWLRKNGFLIKKGEGYNLPTQYAMERELFKIKERTVNNPDGSVRITKTVMVTGKGQQYFVNRFLKGEDKGYCGHT